MLRSHVLPCCQVGTLSQHVRLIRIKNVLTEQEDQLEVPAEESVGEIRQRYLQLNAHANSYTWKAMVKKGGANITPQFEELDLNKTLAENGVPDEVPDFEAYDLPSDYYVPVLHVYWNDDLTVA